MELSQVLKSPVVTEKSSTAQTKHKYSFLVHPDSTKVDIARAVEMAYGVTVTKVHVMTVRAKTRLAGRGKLITKRSANKKALVTVDAKQTIDFNKVKVSK